jgi:predicted GIY-YIG superfamily endonuclease
MSHACYCLLSPTGATYIGYTVNLDRRLRQHNGELSGGAKYTHKTKGWKRICSIGEFPTQRDALQFEWAWKHRSKKFKGTPVEKRMFALVELLNSEQSTRSATPFSFYENPLWILVEDSICSSLETKELQYGCVLS